MMIAFENVVRRFGGRRGGVEALRGVTFGVDKGNVVAVVGPNGAGKSTLFAMALGFLGPTAGRVAIEGGDPRAWVRARGVGYLPERFDLPPAWPVGRALRALARLEVREAAAVVERSLERWGLVSVAERPVGAVSRGLLQRVGLAQAMDPAHALVVLDEPSQGLDPVWRIRLRDEIAALRAGGATVLLASHDLAEVERVADRVVLLDGGRVVESMEPRVPDAPGRWRLHLAGPADVAALFPGAVAAGPHEWIVRAAGAADLSERLAALLAAGAAIQSVEPSGPGLEARVQRALESQGG